MEPDHFFQERPMNFEEAAHHLAVRAGLDALLPDASGAVAISLGEVTINLRPPVAPGAGCCLDAHLGVLRSVDTVTALMADNRWLREAATGALALDTKGKIFLLQYLSGTDMSGTQLLATLERFARQANRWRIRLASNPLDRLSAPLPFMGEGVLA
jgi:hypothetical protein